jgi:hypothetical protein
MENAQQQALAQLRSIVEMVTAFRAAGDDVQGGKGVSQHILTPLWDDAVHLVATQNLGVSLRLQSTRHRPKRRRRVALPTQSINRRTAVRILFSRR